MTILRIISSMDPKSGGPAQGIRNISSHLTQSRIEETIVCLDSPNQDYGITESLSIIRLGNGKTGYHYHPKLLVWLKSNLSLFDIVIVHGLWQYPNYAIYLSIKSLKKNKKKFPKVAIMPHGMLDPYFQKAADRKWKALRNEVVWRATEKKAINTADALFFTCQSEMELARTTFKGYRPKNEINVGYGIQSPPSFLKEFKSAFLEYCPSVKNKEYFLFLSRIDTKKGISILIDAYQALQAEGVALPQLVIAGPVNNSFAEEMQEKAKKNTSIHFPGMLTGDAKWGAFYGASLFVLPSYQENFGIAIVEAMACAVPVLITKKVNIWQEIIQGEAGWAIEVPEVDELKTKILEYVSLSSEEKHKMNVNAQATYEKYYQVETSAQTFVEVLKAI